MNDVYLLTGGNLGDRGANLQQACELIRQFAGRLAGSSSIYETAAWGLTDQLSFLNQVLHFQTDLTPRHLLQQILKTEEAMGRKREKKYGPRIIDIDILFYNHDIIADEDLVIPHPEIANRRFVLVPLNEIAPDFLHPVKKKPVYALLNECTDPLAVSIYKLNS